MNSLLLLAALPSIWSYNGSQFVSAEATADGVRFSHRNWGSWSCSPQEQRKALPGETISFAVPVRKGKGELHMTCVLRDANGKVLEWNWAEKIFRLSDAENVCSNSFAVPDGCASIENRLTGRGEAEFTFGECKCSSEKTELPPEKQGELGNEALRVVCGSMLSVLDKRTGRNWKSSTAVASFLPLDVRKNGDSLQLDLLNLQNLSTNCATISLSSNTVSISFNGTGEWPSSFATQSGDRMIVPLQEGVGLPADEDYPDFGTKALYSGSGLSMPFFGVAEDATGAGWQCIVDTPWDAMMSAKRDGLWSIGLHWQSQKGETGYERKARFVFQEKGGHVAMAKRYRSEKQLHTFREKMKVRPQLDILVGAANIWHWGGDSVEIAKEMQSLGMERLLWSNVGNVKELRKLPNVLVGCYDVYQDIYTPEQTRKLGRQGCNAEAWPDDAAWGPGGTSNDWRKAWGVKAKDGTWTYCAMMCDATAPKWARRKIAGDLAKLPYSSRFLDVTTASHLQECFNPAHPLTRTQSLAARRELLSIPAQEFRLVTGSENGQDWAVQFCDYFEGMLSLNMGRVPDSGRNIKQVWTNAPANVVAYQVGEKYRLPLWELVWHDCCAAHWYWGDYNNKLPGVWEKRDLFNVLYATAPMYFVRSQKHWDEEKARIASSARKILPVARLCGFSEMTDHIIMREDRSLQRTVFSNGTSVEVDFRAGTFRVDRGGGVQD